MRLYLLRHASASDVAPSDAERQLTKEGEEESRIAGAALAELGVQPAHIFSSPLVRARQTAQIAAKELKFSGDLGTLDELLNDTPTSSLLKALKSFDITSELLLIGHVPSLSEHLASVVGAKNPAGFPFGKGSLACIELKQLRVGSGQLRWFMRQKQLRLVAHRRA
ncbi:MAG TPA: phosphohistidine phosphatase SixA [Verrucomicrobiae bacterium]|nr:phosphohistidine phosphatase SixA [Verrucomicrobiae bacterium]